MKKLVLTCLVLSMSLAGLLAQQTVTITIESWRNDDLTIWADKIIPAFEAKNPTIKVVFSPSAPAEYNGVLNTKLEGGTAGDLITARPFDASLALFNKAYLADLTTLSGMNNFSSVAKSAWVTDDGKKVFAVPMASVIHGFFYNKKIFDELKLKVPETKVEFMAVLEAIRKNGKYTPLAMGTSDMWEAATMGFQNIGPVNWKGEEGRLALIKGTQKFTAAAYVKTLRELEAWAPYLPKGYQGVKYPDAQQLFILGKAAIYPTGSWELSVFEREAQFPLGIFMPPVDKKGDTRYISDHTDIALAMNAKTKYPEQSKKFLQWMTTAEFATLYSNALPGFFSLSNHKITLDNPIAQEFISWRGLSKQTIRNSYQILSRGDQNGAPNLENEIWAVSVGVLNKTMKPEAGAKQLQDGLDKWYKPAK